MYKKIICGFFIICLSLFTIGCTGKHSDTNNGDGNYSLGNVSISENTPWNESTNLSKDEKSFLEEVKKEINHDIKLYSEGNINTFLNKTISGMGIFNSTSNTFFEDSNFDKYVANKTDIKVIDIQTVDNNNAKILLNIKYPDMRLPLYKSIKNNELKDDEDITLQFIKDTFEKNPVYKEGTYILNYKKAEDNNEVIYICNNNIRKALTGSLINPGIRKIDSDEDKCEQVNKYLNDCLKLLKDDDLNNYYSMVSSWKIENIRKEVLENEAFKTIRYYFVDNIKIEIIEGKESFRAIVRYPDFNKIFLPLLQEKKNTNEIINEINKSIVDGKVEIVEDTLEGEIYIDGEIKGILDDYSWLFSNLGIDSIDMIMSNFQEPYNFNISTEIEGLN
ncbi:hypothetical protein PM004_07330 [Clostridium paraputrificum]|uniref:hypothetical protein n=1 Tax=Clostridium TaxID=1485 RepID=UPI0006C6CEDF|nr:MULTISPECIES: hypothetical protein [Clostridium]MDB2089146.1 hypothetical protein [Clostridium paraputrificum]MDB2095727.1 hypothetical protein [Clostridium paraputrificum]MDU1180866.1 hypothetical protein [Clostridium sp.]MDU1228237.1 hypothetical protein [Clostridium sp.]MDU1825576.1 hypothetical protein [Clostridium sp.]